MQKSRMKRAAILTSIIVLILGVVILAVAATPGGESDPVVTKSYVDQKISQVEGGSGGTYKAIAVNKGKTLVGGEGTEMILRSGTATAVDNGVNGISDITAAKDLKTGDRVPLEHLIITPRADGRGIKMTSDGFVMVRGPYTIK